MNDHDIQGMQALFAPESTKRYAVASTIMEFSQPATLGLR
jgi:hypothetical protein